jgi:peptidoglycan/xylan/chitin deacetylase (PgdA/CDA1 family)
MTFGAISIVTVNPSLAAVVRISEELETVAIEATVRALGPAILEAKQRAKERAGALVPVVLPSDHPELVLAASAFGADRIAVMHTKGSVRGVRASAVRAAFALVDLTIVDDDETERDAVNCGADPDRMVRTDGKVAERLIFEPRRKGRRRAAVEAAVSLALDAAELSGLIRVLETASPDRGVNVVNYHRILPLDEITSYCRPQMALAEPLFEAQLDLIARRRGFTRIDRVRDRMSNGKVAITFDDGYEDNFRVALPILQRFSTPACIFVVTNLIGRPDALWWDRLGLALFVYWRDGCAVSVPTELPDEAKKLQLTSSFEQARQIISDVITLLNRRSFEARMDAVVAAESLVPKLTACRTMLSWDEVSEMAAVGITFGAHTRNHVPLDEVSADAARDELFGSQKDLDARLDVEQPNVVALPRGRLGPLTENEMREHGVAGVMTTEPGVNRTGGASLFVMRRDGRMLTLHGRHHPAKLRLELTGIVDRLRTALTPKAARRAAEDAHAGKA